MPYVKVTGYIDVPDEYYDGSLPEPLTPDGYAEVDLVQVTDLEDLTINRDDRGGRR